MHHARGHLHGVFDQGALDDVEGFTGEDVVHSDWSFLVQGWVALRQVAAEFLKQLDCAVECGWIGVAAFPAAFGDAFCFVGVEFEVVVVQFFELSA